MALRPCAAETPRHFRETKKVHCRVREPSRRSRDRRSGRDVDLEAPQNPMTWSSRFVPTRFSPPELQEQVVVRRALLERLRGFSRRKVTVLVGGAGFGKTTLLAQWFDACANPGLEDVGWVTLPQGEGDLKSLFAYLFEAIHRIGVEFDQTVPVSLVGDNERGAKALVSAFVNAIAEHPRNVRLILDDAHHISDPLALEALRDLLEQSTENFHLTLAARHLPAMSLSRLQIREQVGDVGSEQLAFDRVEMAEFFNGRTGQPLSDQQLKQLRESFEGWPAGMQLAIHAMREGRSSASLSELLRDSMSFRNYLTENVLVALATDQLAFLERLSIVPRFCESLAAAVTQVSDAEPRIRQLMQMHMFVSRFDLQGEEAWYGMHPLFADVLRARLLQREVELQACHQRAFTWYAVNGFLMDAVGHAKAAGEIGTVGRVIDNSPMVLRSLASLGSVRRIADALDPGKLPSDSKLLPLGAWAYLLTAQVRRASRWLRCLDPDRNPDSLLQRRVLEGGVALYQDDMVRVREWVGNLHPAEVEQPFLRQCLATMLITAAQAKGDYAKASAITSEFVESLRLEQHEMALIVHALAVVSLLESGNAVLAEQQGLRVLRQAETVAGRRSVSAAVAAAFLADAQMELGRFEDARATLDGRWDMIYYSPPDPLMRGVITLVRLATHFGGPQAGFNVSGPALPRLQGRGADRAVALVLLEEFQLKKLAGSETGCAAVVARIAQIAIGDAGEEGFGCDIKLAGLLATAQLALMRGRTPEALESLIVAEQIARQRSRTRVLVTVLLLAAQCHSALKQQAAADIAIQEAVELCDAGGLRQAALNAGGSAIQLVIARASKLRMSSELLEFLRTQPTKLPSGPSTDGPGAELLQKLTPREIEIIRLLGQSMSNKRIAAALDIAPATVKWNLQNVYLKLGLNTRYDVIMWMRRMEVAVAH
ncbi:MAG: hypothetical protein EOP24_31500 [Hyphomicrobiales bacterium]|nr:MAG: hypothetical protein EOP24_31500 [Hyphomicrobiales bacterium]